MEKVTEFHDKIRKYLSKMPNIGEKFPNSNLICIDRDFYRNKPSRGVEIFVLCPCGKRYYALASKILHEHPIKFCHNCSRIHKGYNPNDDWKGKKGIPYDYFSRTKRRAIKSELAFEVRNPELYELFVKQSQSCALTGVPISFDDKTASLDRINSSIGYISNNVQWVHKDVNRMKSNFDQPYFISICNSVVKRNEVTKSSIFDQLGMTPIKEDE